MEQPTVTVETLQDWLAQGQPVTILDIRRAADRAEWAIPGSRHVDVYDALQTSGAAALAAIDLPPETPVVVVCMAGKTSLRGAEQLRTRGIPALSLAGGMRAWSQAWNHAALDLPGSTARIIQVRRTGKGCLSYLVGCGAEAAVLDAALDPAVYRDLAAQQGWQIRQVLDTHIHADHLSRSRALAAQTGAMLSLPAAARVAYPFQALQEGDGIPIGTTQLRVLSTPGHTVESSCYLLEGGAVFTGDTLFLTAVGRPDLGANHTEAAMRAAALYDSLQQLVALPDDTLILPGHTSQPIAFDGQPLAAPLRVVRQQVGALHLPKPQFVAHLLEHLPPPPPNHARIAALNHAGVLPDGDLAELEAGANRCAVA